jgi:hypothetical protein
MTIQELCDRLTQFPPDTPVVVKGYEGRFNDVHEVETLEIQLIEGISITPVIYLHGVNHIADEDWHNR